MMMIATPMARNAFTFGHSLNTIDESPANNMQTETPWPYLQRRIILQRPWRRQSTRTVPSHVRSTKLDRANYNKVMRRSTRPDHRASATKPSDENKRNDVTRWPQSSYSRIVISAPLKSTSQQTTASLKDTWFMDQWNNTNSFLFIHKKPHLHSTDTIARHELKISISKHFFTVVISSAANWQQAA